MGMNRLHKRNLKATRIEKKRNYSKEKNNRKELSGTGKRFYIAGLRGEYERKCEQAQMTNVECIDQIEVDDWTKSHNGKPIEYVNSGSHYRVLHDMTRWQGAKKMDKIRSSNRGAKQEKMNL